MAIFLLMYESHDMRHTNFPQVDGGQRNTPGNGASRLFIFNAYFVCK